MCEQFIDADIATLTNILDGLIDNKKGLELKNDYTKYENYIDELKASYDKKSDEEQDFIKKLIDDGAYIRSANLRSKIDKFLKNFDDLKDNEVKIFENLIDIRNNDNHMIDNIVILCKLIFVIFLI